MYINSAKELIAVFNVRNNLAYERVIPLSDCKVGFSIQRKYPADIRYRPPKLMDGTDEAVALIHVIYEHPDEEKQEEQGSRVPLIIRITNYSRYRANHFDYNFYDPNCPTKESLEKSKLTPTPVELNYEKYFYYDHTDNQFYDESGRVFTGLEVLERVYDDHCDTVHLLKGLKLRRKPKSQSFGIYILGIFVGLLKWGLSSMFGRTLDDSDTISTYFSGYARENLKKLSTDSITVFGYSTAKRVIILFCLLAVTIFTWYFYSPGKNKYLKAIFSNGFLSLIFSIVIIWILDVIVPILLFRFVNILIKMRTKLLLRKFKVF
jgi:hypothetical protein